jgi:hypothetical protein
MVKRKARDADLEKFWRQAHERQKASGSSVTGFCQSEGLKDYTFWYWGRELKARDRASMVAKLTKGSIKRRRNLHTGDPEPTIENVVPAVGRKSKKQKVPSLDQSDQDNQPENDFAPVHLIGDDEIVADTKPAGVSSIVEIVLKCGRLIRISADCPPEFLTKIVAAVEGH